MMQRRATGLFTEEFRPQIQSRMRDLKQILSHNADLDLKRLVAFNFFETHICEKCGSLETGNMSRTSGRP